MPADITITFAKSAVADLKEMQAWYSEQCVPDVGERFVREIVAKIETLQAYPEMGRIVPEFGIAAIRELIHPPFRIVYRCDKERIRIVRIWRSERLMTLP